MKCKGLFDRNKVVIIPVTDETISHMMSDVKSYASYHGLKIKTEAGLFIKQDTMFIEKVIRCEVIGEVEPSEIVKLKSSTSPNNDVFKRAREQRQKVKEERKQKREELKQKRKELKQKREERKKQIFDDFYQKNLSVKQIALKYNISRQGVYYILDKE